MSRGDTLSLFKRRGEKGIGLVVGGYGEAKRFDGIEVTLPEILTRGYFPDLTTDLTNRLVVDRALAPGTARLRPNRYD